uniref:PiggyBac transposable element-derived protein domain-containing protein n=1 Tax=Octopus bimaculoides TaxID=37653 RepID=A0A0L8FWP1_OCTBM
MSAVQRKWTVLMLLMLKKTVWYTVENGLLPVEEYEIKNNIYNMYNSVRFKCCWSFY